MKIDWTPDVGTVSTLGDDSNYKTILLEGFAGQALLQNDPLAWADYAYRDAHGNVSGEFSVTVTQSLEAVEDVATHLFTEYLRLGQKGTLQWTRGAAVYEFTNAILVGVQAAEINGVKVAVRYRWSIGPMAAVLP